MDRLGDIVSTFNSDAKTEIGIVFFSNLASKTAFDVMINGVKQDSFSWKALKWANKVFPLTVDFLTAASGAEDSLTIEYAVATWVQESLKLKEYPKEEPDSKDASQAGKESGKTKPEQPAFMDAIQNHYQQQPCLQKFGNTEDLMEKVKQKTKKSEALVQDLFDSTVIRRKDFGRIGPDTGLILAAALHFKGEWSEVLEDGGHQQTLIGKGYVKEFENYSLLSVPFKQHKESNFSMLFLLPKKMESTHDLLQFINEYEDVIRKVDFPNEAEEKGSFVIPEFKSHNLGDFDLKKTYDLDQIANSTLFCRGGRVSSFIEVSKSGVRAAGVSAYFIDKKPPQTQSSRNKSQSEKLFCKAGNKPNDGALVVDPPFLFFIHDNVFGRLMFSGAVYSN